MVQINFASLDKRFDSLVDPLEQKALGVFKFLKKKNVSVDIYLINGQRMKVLNQKYRGKNSITDVLAIESPKDFPEVGGNKHLGEIYLNPPHVRTKEYNLEFALIHGILHLLGFDHQGKSDKMEMEKEEKKILKWLNHTF